MEILSVDGVNGPIRHLVVSAWRVDAMKYRVILDNPKLCKFIVLTLDVRDVIREALQPDEVTSGAQDHPTGDHFDDL